MLSQHPRKVWLHILLLLYHQGGSHFNFNFKKGHAQNFLGGGLGCTVACRPFAARDGAISQVITDGIADGQPSQRDYHVSVRLPRSQPSIPTTAPSSRVPTHSSCLCRPERSPFSSRTNEASVYATTLDAFQQIRVIVCPAKEDIDAYP